MDLYVDQEVKIGESKPPRRKLEGAEKYIALMAMRDRVQPESEEEEELLNELEKTWYDLTEDQIREVEDAVEAERAKDPNYPVSGGLYRHYKGGIYTVVGIGHHHDSRYQYVIYFSHEKKTLNL